MIRISGYRFEGWGFKEYTTIHIFWCTTQQMRRGGNNNTPFAIDTDGQGIPGAPKGGARGEAYIHHYPK